MSSLKDVLEKQHRRVIDLLDQTEEAPESNLLRALADEIVGHTLAEEELVYPLSQRPHGSEERALEEHALLRYALERLLGARPGKPTFAARVRMLRELLIHHYEQEERARLPVLEKRIGSRRSHELAERVASRFEELVACGHERALRNDC
jgi:iron-sulfur cluster repair protein YtfE (RIC family)